MKLYRAESLEDIAAAFDKRAADESNQAKWAKTHRDGLSHQSAANAWKAAAQILRNTDLTA